MGTRRVLAALMTAAVALSLTACAGRTPQGETPDSPSPTASAEAPAPTEPAREGRVTAAMDIRQENISSADGAQSILTFLCTTPQVTIAGRPEAQEAVNEALLALEEAFTQGGEAGGGLEEYTAAAQAEYEFRQQEGGNEYPWSYALEQTVLVARGDSRILSFVYDEYSNMGGAHGNSVRRGVTFDTATGARLEVGELSEDSQGFAQWCGEYALRLSQSQEYGGYTFNQGYEETLAQLAEQGSWYLNGEGLVIVANPDDIAPYAAGRLEFSIPYAELDGWLRPEYQPEETAFDGTVTGVVAEPDACCTPYAQVDDGTGGQGASILFRASGTVGAVSLLQVQYLEYSDSYRADNTLWYASELLDGDVLMLRTWIPDTIPNRLLRYTGAQGPDQEYLISQSGKDGSLLMLEEETEPLSLPAQVDGRLPLSYDLDGDGEMERLNVVRYADELGNTALALTVTQADGTVLESRTEYLGNTLVWLADLDGDGTVEILFSGDVASDDYYTICCRYRGGVLEAVSFLKGGVTTARLNGRVTAVDGSSLTVSEYIDVLGTYEGTRQYTMGDSGAIGPASGSEWSFSENGYWLQTIRELPVTMESGAFGTVPGIIPAGSRLLVTAWDGANTLRFVTEDYRTGLFFVQLASDQGGWLVGGVSEYEYFATLPYVG